VLDLVVKPLADQPSDDHLRHMRLSREDLAAGLSLAEARARFAEFAGSDAAVAAWTQTTLDWGRSPEGRGVLPAAMPAMLLKTAYCNVRNHSAGLLEEVVQREGLTRAQIACRGRAANRLGNAMAVASLLRQEQARFAVR
jgi:hypothetical protein